MSDTNESRQEYIARMVAEGWEIDYPESNELFIDIDTKAHLFQFYDSWECFLRNFRPMMRDLGVSAEDLKYLPDPTHEIINSRNGGEGYHIRIKLPYDVDSVERIALQSALGSDPLRELLSYIRFKRGDVHPTIFVEKGKL